MKLVAIGGGGATHAADPGLDNLLLAVSGKKTATVGYIGAASRDDDAKFERFRSAFPGATQLKIDDTAAVATEWIGTLDVLYVGGGNTAFLIKHFASAGILPGLRAAAENGLLLSGVSAGAVCWFETALSNSRGSGLEPLAGLGWFAGSCCPHFDSEPTRREVYAKLIAAARMPPGLAIDDGAAVVLDGDLPPLAFSARPNAWAYLVKPRSHSAERILLGSWPADSPCTGTRHA